jgi:branched-chain amino acid transport system permease protein
MSPRPGVFALQLAAGVTVAALLPVFVNGGLVFLAGLVLINIVVALAFNLLFATTGLISFGQSLYVAAGAYTVGAIQLYAPEIPFLAALATGGLVGAAFAFAVAYVSLQRSEGVYLAMLTLTFAELLHVVITKTTWLGRSDGLTNIPRPIISLGFARLDLTSLHGFYGLIVAVTALLIALLWWVTHARLGRTLRAIKMDAARASFLGVNVRAYRVASFTIAGGITAVAGGLLGPWTQILTPDLAEWQSSTAPLLHTLLGGSGSFWGPAVGAIVFAAVDYGTRSLQGVSELVTGGLLLCVILLVPGGLVGLLTRLHRPASARRSLAPARPVP